MISPLPSAICPLPFLSAIRFKSQSGVDAKQAISQVEALQPDVVLMDARMPVMHGVAATKAITQQFPQVKVLILTTFDDDEYIT